MTVRDIQALLNNMIYDGAIEEVPTPSDLGQKGVVKYKKAKPFRSAEHLAESPCGVCPVASQCHENGEISPSTCVYLPEWMTHDYRKVEW